MTASPSSLADFESYRDKFIALASDTSCFQDEERLKELIHLLSRLRSIIQLRIGTEKSISTEFLQAILRILHTIESSSSSSFLLEAAELSTQCAMNSLYENSTAIDIFLQLQGTAALFHVLQLRIPPSLAYFIVKLLYMIFSSSASNAIHILTLPSKLMDLNFSEVLVATFVSSVQSSIITKHRRLLYVDCCKLLYAIEHFYQKTFTSDSKNSSNANSADLAAQRALLPSLKSIEKTLMLVQSNVVKILLLESTRDLNIFQCKLASLQLLLLADKKSLLSLTAVPGVLNSLYRLLDLLLCDYQSDAASVEFSLTTLLVLLHHICECSSSLRDELKTHLLPSLEELDALSAVRKEGEEEDKNAPPKYPRHSRMAKLLSLLQSLNTTLNRTASEVLFALCNQNGKRAYTVLYIHIFSI